MTFEPMKYKYFVHAPGVGDTYCNNGIDLDNAIRFALERIGHDGPITVNYIGEGSELPVHRVTFPSSHDIAQKTADEIDRRREMAEQAKWIIPAKKEAL